MQKCRIRPRKDIWEAAAIELLTNKKLPTINVLCKTTNIKSRESAKRVHMCLIEAMGKLIGKTIGTEPPTRRVSCRKTLGSQAERLRQHARRVYTYEQVIEKKRGYKAVIICSPKYRENHWHIENSRFAITRDAPSIPLRTIVSRYYYLPSTYVAIVSKKHIELAREMNEVGFMLCHHLEDEPRRSWKKKEALMREQLNDFEHEVINSQVWPKDNRTPTSVRLDARLGHCAIRFMFKNKFSQNELKVNVNNLVTEAFQILKPEREKMPIMEVLRTPLNDTAQ